MKTGRDTDAFVCTSRLGLALRCSAARHSRWTGILGFPDNPIWGIWRNEDYDRDSR